MKHELMDHEQWQRELVKAALAICDLYNPSMAWSLRSGIPDSRFEWWIAELRSLAWKPGYRTTFQTGPDA